MVWRTDGQMYSVCWGGGSYLVGFTSWVLSVCRFCGSPALLAFKEEGSWQSGQEAILRCGETTPAVGFAITNCELGHSNSSFLPSSTRAPVGLDGKMVGKRS